MTLTLKWDNIHKQSREQLCLGSGVRIEVAKKPWSEIEPWLRKLIADNNIYGFKVD